jgi:hypothetical protein
MGDEEGGILYELETPDGKQNTSKRYTGTGKALYTNEPRDSYDGEFVEGFRCGWGTYVFGRNGDKYVGQYEQNLKHGLGKMTYSSKTGAEEEDEGDENKKPRGGFYHGYFTRGKRGNPEHKKDVPGETGKSEGTFTYCNGDVYIGQWKDGKKHGKGTYSFAKDGSKMKGEWVDGKMSSGQWIFPNGTFWSGKFRYNKPYGQGVWVFANGNQLTGNYVQKELVDEEGEAPPEDEGAEKKDPKVECFLKFANPVLVKGDAPPRQQKFTMTRG